MFWFDRLNKFMVVIEMRQGIIVFVKSDVINELCKYLA